MLKRHWIVSSCQFLEQLILYFGMIIAEKTCDKQQFKWLLVQLFYAKKGLTPRFSSLCCNIT